MNLKEFQCVKEISFTEDKLCDGLHPSVGQKRLKQVVGKRTEVVVISSDAGGCLECSMWGMWEEKDPRWA